MKILVVDDEFNLRNTLCRFLEIEGHTPVQAEDGVDALEKIKSDNFDVIMTDMKMPRMSGMQLLEQIKDLGIRTPVIMMSAFGETKDAVNAMKLGAKDYIVKPLALDEVILRIKNVYSMFNLENSMTAIKKVQDEGFVGDSVPIKNIKATVQKISNSTSNVLITGESGTGKEVLARYIHNNSPVSSGPFMAINIAGVPDNMIESELFGYEKGAFTGASSRKIGLFEMAQGGTVFLDEIGDASAQLQVKLLRVLQEKKIMRLAGTGEIPINVRFISATNRNIEQDVKNKLFREDLYFRLNVIKIDLPTLNQRVGDIPLLAEFMIDKFNKKMSKHVKGVSPETIKMLEAHKFSGNVRELENLLERAMIFCKDDAYITPDMISFTAFTNPQSPVNNNYSQGYNNFNPNYNNMRGMQNQYGNPYNAGYAPYGYGQPYGQGYSQPMGYSNPMNNGYSQPNYSQSNYNYNPNQSENLSLKQNEIENIRKALIKHDGNRTKAAEELGISRRTLLNKIDEYGL